MQQITELSSIDVVTQSEQGIVWRFKDPRTGAESGGWVKFKGMFSAIAQEQTQRMRDRMIERQRAETPALPSVKETNDQQADDLADLAIDAGGWTHNGKPVEFSRTNMHWLFLNFPLVRQQAWVFVNDVGNVMPPLVEASSSGPAETSTSTTTPATAAP